MCISFFIDRWVSLGALRPESDDPSPRTYSALCGALTQGVGEKRKIFRMQSFFLKRPLAKNKRALHCRRPFETESAVSSVVEHYLDTVGVTGSKPVSRTISNLWE
jgi:hypothetical protein